MGCLGVRVGQNAALLLRHFVKSRQNAAVDAHGGQGLRNADNGTRRYTRHKVFIKRIFDEYLAGGTTYSIADALNGEGISRSMRNGNKRLWTPMDIQRTLRNALYAGYIASGEELFEGQHKALISRAEWERVQTKLNSASSIVKQRVKRTRPRMVYSLSGLLRCARCGTLMTGSYGMKGETLYKYYTCTTRKKYGERGCACPSLNAEQIEGFVKEQMMGLRNDEEFIAAVISRIPGIIDGKISDCLFNMGNCLGLIFAV